MTNAIASQFHQLMTGRNSLIGRYDRKNKTKRFLALYTCIGLVGLILVLLLMASPGLTQKPQPQPQEPLLVATRVIPPFVISNKGELSGFSIDLRHSITNQIGAESKFIQYPSVPELQG
ncbi:hypothetical protein [Nostoc sp. NMS8]|uniref:hypothetical protein n=1 Tax=Nostoc sp. NMS8 TaxID=2815392 RepID=UPI0025F38287|nr:hypothetical protein [Nostoc sp. NMS8]MBN3958312.1 hypothetical protein [Nostoc sp. NMS8]